MAAQNCYSSQSLTKSLGLESYQMQWKCEKLEKRWGVCLQYTLRASDSG